MVDAACYFCTSCLVLVIRPVSVSPQVCKQCLPSLAPHVRDTHIHIYTHIHTRTSTSTHTHPHVRTHIHTTLCIQDGLDLEDLPAALLAKGSKVKELVLSRNRISSVPPEISQLCCLRTLKLDLNAITHLPAEIGLLPELQVRDSESLVIA